METNAYRYWATENSFYQWKRSELQKTLTLEDWLSMNASLGLVRIDSKYAQIYESDRIKLGNFKLYKIHDLSPVRTNSIRFLMNDCKDFLLVLNMSPEPITSLWKNLTETSPDCEKLLHHPDCDKKSINSILLDYIKFYFNNVLYDGVPYHIVESLEDIKNRVNNHLNLSSKSGPDNALYSADQWQGPLDMCARLYNKDVSCKIVESKANGSTLTSGYTIPDILFIRDRSLKKADVFVSTGNEKYGELTLHNEMTGSLTEDPDETGEFKIVFTRPATAKPEIEENTQDQIKEDKIFDDQLLAYFP